jgi:hypothetical protein
MTPDPLKDWYADASKQTQLTEALNLPIVKEAMALLREIAIPRTDYTDRTSAEAITHSAMEQNRTAGFFSYPRELWELTEVPKKPPTRPEGYSDSHVKDWAKRQGMWQDFEQTEQQPT